MKKSSFKIFIANRYNRSFFAAYCICNSKELHVPKREDTARARWRSARDFGMLSANRIPPTCGCKKNIVGGERRLKCRTIRISRTIRIRISRTTRTTRTRISRTTIAEFFENGKVHSICYRHQRNIWNYQKLYEFLIHRKRGLSPFFCICLSKHAKQSV